MRLLTLLHTAAIGILTGVVGSMAYNAPSGKSLSVIPLIDASVCITDPDPEKPGSGSGTIIKSDHTGTYIVTAFHVIKGIKTPLVKQTIYDDAHRMVFRDYATYRATLVASDPSQDLAIIRLTDTRKIFSTIQVADGVGPALGDPTVSVGCALSRNPYVTRGVLNAQAIEAWSEPLNLIATTAGIVPGNSGGVIGWFNSQTDQWELAGVVSGVATANNQFVAHMGVAIRYETVQALMKKAKL